MTLARAFQPFACTFAALVAALTLASCGSGAVGAPPSPTVNSPTVTILPATAVLYSGLPTTFILSGGTGPYVVTSSDQAVVPISGGVTGGSFTVVPNPVLAETTVTLSVRDTASAAPVTATLTVRPGTVTNNVTITPNAQQSASCNPGICSGGDAEVAVTISQGGIPLGARGIRFDVISGDFRFITTPPGTVPEQTALSVNVATDETGIARARIRVTVLAPNQTALLQITDILSGAFRRVSFGIAQFTGNTPAFFVLPSSVTFTGPFENECASSGDAIVSIFGGAPPYTITGGSSDVFVSRSFVEASGGQFAVQLRGNKQCVTDLPVTVTDSTGRTLTVTVSNVAGTGTLSAVSIAPETFTLTCGPGLSSFTVSGGRPPFIVKSDHPGVVITYNSFDPRTVSVQRSHDLPGTTYPTTAHITVTDGATGATATGTVPAFCP